MGTSTTETGTDIPADPSDLLPEDSVLTLEDYLAMHAAIGHTTRYEIVYRLVHGGDMSPKELEEVIEIDDSTLHYHLNKLIEVGLIQKRKRTERNQEGLYIYYSPTVFGRITLTEGVDELMRGEHEFEEMYTSAE